MNKEYWQQKWISQEIGFNQLQPNILMQRFFPSLKLKPGSQIFVPLCGQTIDMLWLAGQGYQVVGVELSSIACNTFFEENKIRVKKSQIDDFVVYSSDEITIFSGDFFKLNHPILGKVDAVYDRAALIALPADIRKSYSEHMVELIELNTDMFLITTSYNQTEMPGPPFSVDENEVSTLYGSNFEIKNLYSKPMKDIPVHLKSKGLMNAVENAFKLTKI